MAAAPPRRDRGELRFSFSSRRPARPRDGRVPRDRARRRRRPARGRRPCGAVGPLAARRQQRSPDGLPLRRERSRGRRTRPGPGPNGARRTRHRGQQRGRVLREAARGHEPAGVRPNGGHQPHGSISPGARTRPSHAGARQRARGDDRQRRRPRGVHRLDRLCREQVRAAGDARGADRRARPERRADHPDFSGPGQHGHLGRPRSRFQTRIHQAPRHAGARGRGRSGAVRGDAAAASGRHRSPPDAERVHAPG